MALLLNVLWTATLSAVVKLKYISGLHSCKHTSYMTKWSRRLVIVSGRSKGDHVTRDLTDTCCHRQEIPATQSRRWYHRSRIDVTLLLATPPIPTSGGWWKDSFWPRASGDRLIIFTLNRKDWHSDAEWLGLDLKGLFCKSTINNTTAQNKKTCNILWPRTASGPLGPCNLHRLPRSLVGTGPVSNSQNGNTLLSLSPDRNPLDFATCSNDWHPCCQVSQWHVPVLLNSDGRFWLAEMRREYYTFPD